MSATVEDVGIKQGQHCQVLAYLLQGLQYFSLMVQEHLALVRGHIHIISAARHAPLTQNVAANSQEVPGQPVVTLKAQHPLPYLPPPPTKTPAMHMALSANNDELDKQGGGAGSCKLQDTKRPEEGS